MNDVTEIKRREHTSREKNLQMMERTVIQDESGFPSQIPINSQNDRVYFKGQKKDISKKNPYRQIDSVLK